MKIHNFQFLASKVICYSTNKLWGIKIMPQSKPENNLGNFSLLYHYSNQRIVEGIQFLDERTDT